MARFGQKVVEVNIVTGERKENGKVVERGSGSSSSSSSNGLEGIDPAVARLLASSRMELKQGWWTGKVVVGPDGEAHPVSNFSIREVQAVAKKYQ